MVPLSRFRVFRVFRLFLLPFYLFFSRLFTGGKIGMGGMGTI